MTVSAAEALLVIRKGAAGIVTLNRPAAINAINDEIRTRLPAVVHELDQDAKVAAIVIVGAGERGFCSGADIKEVRPQTGAAGERQRLMPTTWIEGVASATKPTIAVLHGVCMGAGLELALACDLRVAASDSRFALPETALGLIPGGGGTQRLARLVGQGRALDMILTGQVLEADSARAAGLLTRVSESRESALAEALEIAERLSDRPPLALAYAKEAVLAGVGLPLIEGLRLERSLFAILAATRDRREAAEAFRAKRKPNFSGE